MAGTTGTVILRNGSGGSVAAMLVARDEGWRFLLDTTVLIDHLRGRPAAERVSGLVAAGEVVGTCPVNVEEIHRGLRDHEADAARQLFDGLVIYPLDRRAGQQAGEWRRGFARRGITLSQADCLIAAAAFGADAILATGNTRDFPMDGLRIEHWPIGGVPISPIMPGMGSMGP